MVEKKPKILIVHNSENERAKIQLALQTFECLPFLASNHNEALVLAKSNPPDLLIFEWNGKAESTYEAAEAIRRSCGPELIPVLFLTESIGKAASKISAGLEAVDFLSKDEYPVLLTARCQSLLQLEKFGKELTIAEQVLRSLALAVEARDPTTGNHCDRLIQQLSRAADFLGLTEKERDALIKGAVLHDIGKVGVPDHILLKEGPLTDREWEVMRQHVTIGESLCRPLAFLHSVLPIIRHHHERFDGTGYPDGLIGEKIPFIARVFQVCDVFDALTNPRPYKPAFSKEESILILKKEAEKGWWDPKIVNSFILMVHGERV